jgi:DNA mismatch repair protein MutS2
LKARAIVTTHLSALKAVAFTAPRAENASVEFDSVSLRPTYHVRLGEPGNSNALIIAKRLGMSARLVQLARSYLDDTTRALNKAIEGTLGSRRQAEAARKAAREAELGAQRERENLERERKELEKSQYEYERWTAWVNGLKPGDHVHLRKLNRPARVVRMQLHKQTALVSAGPLDIEVPLRDVCEPVED